MSGFVYIWYDRKHKRYYIGSHWGKENDGYVCSSRWMIQAYRHRPQDFKRRILSRGFVMRKDLFAEEIRWHSMMKDEELGKRYYNIKRHSNHWSSSDERRKTVAQKISERRKGIIYSEEYKKKISLTMKGRTKSPKHRMALSKSKRGMKKTWQTTLPKSHREAISRTHKARYV